MRHGVSLSVIALNAPPTTVAASHLPQGSEPMAGNSVRQAHFGKRCGDAVYFHPFEQHFASLGTLGSTSQLEKPLQFNYAEDLTQASF